MNPQEIDQYEVYQMYFTKSLNQDIVKLINYLTIGFNKNNSLENCIAKTDLNIEKWSQILNNWIDYLDETPGSFFKNKVQSVLNMKQSKQKNFEIAILTFLLKEIRVIQFGDLEIQINQWWGGRVQSDPIKYTRNQLKEKLVVLFENKRFAKQILIID